MKDQAIKALDMAIESFSKRRNSNKETYIPPHVSDAMVGFSTESVREALGGIYDPLIEQIANGNIRGIRTIVGCTTARYGQGGSSILKLLKD